jgi:hypothetical protein
MSKHTNVLSRSGVGTRYAQMARGEDLTYWWHHFAATGGVYMGKWCRSELYTGGIIQPLVSTCTVRCGTESHWTNYMQL